MSCAKGCCPDQRTHYRGVIFGVGQHPETLREKQLDKDMAAYKIARQNGTPLRSIGGAAELTSLAQSPVEIERGHLIRNSKLLKQMESYAKDAPPPTTTPAA